MSRWLNQGMFKPGLSKCIWVKYFLNLHIYFLFYITRARRRYAFIFITIVSAHTIYNYTLKYLERQTRQIHFKLRTLGKDLPALFTLYKHVVDLENQNII